MSGPQAIIFNYAAFIARYPQLAPLPQALLQEYFNEAGLLYYRNDGGWQSSIPQAPTLLNMLTAHIALLNCPRDANGNPAATGTDATPLVGRIDQATQGSVNVHADMGDANEGSPSQSWYLQTEPGAAYWFACSRFRTARYVPPPWPGSRVPTALFGGRRIW